MKLTLLLVALCLAVGLGSAIRDQSDKQPVLINRPQFDTFGPRQKRAPWPWARATGVKGHNPSAATPSPLDLRVRKGEYVCGNRICKLEPGVVPKGCNGICQYPV